jgi:energy-coupling factor transporter ATP-binding protein EcfA2
VFCVVLTGPAGAGKTTVLTALSDALIDDEIPHAAVDVDEIAWAFPFPSLAQRSEHLRAWCTAHLQAGHDLLLASEVIESPDHLGEILASLHAGDHLLVRLEAAVATLRQRIIAREPPGWSQLDWLLEDAERTHVTLAGLEGVHLVLDTERLTTAEITTRIRAARPDKLRRPNEIAGGATRDTPADARPP